MSWKKARKTSWKWTKAAARGADRLKHSWTEPWLDKYVAGAGVNLGIMYQAAEIFDRTNYSPPTYFVAGMATAAALGAADYVMLSPRAREFRQRATDLIKSIDKNRAASWIKTAALVGTTAFLGSELNPYFQQARQDIFPRMRDPPLVTDARPVVPSVTRERPKAYDTIGHTPEVVPEPVPTPPTLREPEQYDFTGTKLAGKNSMTGRIQRTLRWQPIYHAVERQHGLPKDTLAGMIMQESYGDPVQPNASNDGGLGLTHIQGTVAPRYGLRVHGSSTRDSDRAHGRSIRDMLRACNYDPACAQQYDDRAHPIKVLDAAARIVREGREKHGSWDEGVEYYRAPGRVGRNLTWRYLRDVKHWRDGIRDREQLGRAARDFEGRNGYSFDTYISKWHEVDRRNWELGEYVNGGLSPTNGRR